MDSVSKDKRSGIMRLIKSKGTSLERVLRNQLWKRGIRYRKNNSTLFGKPDISIVSKNIVVFIDSCFWHGCNEHLRMPHSNTDYWNNKIWRNKKRDQIVIEHYKEKKWKILDFGNIKLKTILKK